MKICWDNLENVSFTRNGNFRHKDNTYYEGICDTCGDDYLKSYNSKGNFCSNPCRIPSQESRDKSSKGNLGKIVSQESRDKMSKSHKGKYRGDKSPHWKPHLTDEDRNDFRTYPEYREWRTKVYERDNYTCQKCSDSKGRNLNAHHIEAYNSNKELRTVVDNGITWCEDCHKDFHHQYGYGDNTREQYNEFMNIKE